MSETITDRHKNTKPLNARVPPDYLTFLDKYYQEQGLESRSQGLVKILESYRLLGLQTSEESAPVTCKTSDDKTCPKFGGITKEGILCMTKKSQLDPIRYQFLPFVVAKVCSDKPFNTAVDKKSQEKYETGIDLLESDNASLKRKVEIRDNKLERLEPKFKELQSENSRLSKEVAPMEEILKQRDALQKVVDDELIPFKNDNVYLRNLVKELSHDSVVEKNKELLDQLEEIKQAMKIQESNHSANIKDLNLEIKKWEALAKTEKDKNIDMRFTLEKAFRDFKQFLPTESRSCEVCSEGGFKLKEYRQSALKSIENLEGYLQTVAR